MSPKTRLALIAFADSISEMALGCYQTIGEARTRDVIEKSEALKMAIHEEPPEADKE